MSVNHQLMAENAKKVAKTNLLDFEIGEKKDFINYDRVILKEILQQPGNSEYKNVINHIKKIADTNGVELGSIGGDGHVYYSLKELYFIFDELLKMQPQPKYAKNIPVAWRLEKAFVIALSNLKGGTGKSSSLIHLAIALALAGYTRPRILILDSDPQGQVYLSMDGRALDFNNVPSVGSICTKKTPRPTDKSQREFLLESAVIKSHITNIDFIPGQPEDQDLQKMLDNLYSEEKRGNKEAYKVLYKEIIEPLENDYDLILIDLPPANNIAVANAVYAADGIIIPAAARPMDAHSTLSYIPIISDWLTEFEESIEEYKPLGFMKLLPVADDSSTVARQQIRKFKQAMGADNVLKSIPFAKAYGMANSDNNKSLFDYPNQSQFLGSGGEWKDSTSAWKQTADTIMSEIEDLVLFNEV